MMIQLVNYPFNSSVTHRPQCASEALTRPGLGVSTPPGVTEIGATGGIRLLNGSLELENAGSYGVVVWRQTSSVRGEMFPTLENSDTADKRVVFTQG